MLKTALGIPFTVKGFAVISDQQKSKHSILSRRTESSQTDWAPMEEGMKWLHAVNSKSRLKFQKQNTH